MLDALDIAAWFDRAPAAHKGDGATDRATHCEHRHCGCEARQRNEQAPRQRFRDVCEHGDREA